MTTYQIELLASINALPLEKKAFLLSTQDKYFVMGVRPYHFFCYDDDGIEMLASSSEEEALHMCETLNNKVDDGWYEYKVFKLSLE